MSRKSLLLGFIMLIVVIALMHYNGKVAKNNPSKSTAQNTPATHITQIPTVLPTTIPSTSQTSLPTGLPDIQKPSYTDISYLINGELVSLKNGLSEVQVTPDSSSKVVTRYFGNEAFGDVNGDHRDDVAFLLTQNTGGSGTFYYVVAALQTETGYTGSNAVLLGDRIAPQTTTIENGVIVVKIADRKADEPFTTSPSVTVSKSLEVKDGMLVEVSHDQLTGRSWNGSAPS